MIPAVSIPHARTALAALTVTHCVFANDTTRTYRASPRVGAIVVRIGARQIQVGFLFRVVWLCAVRDPFINQMAVRDGNVRDEARILRLALVQTIGNGGEQVGVGRSILKDVQLISEEKHDVGGAIAVDVTDRQGSWSLRGAGADKDDGSLEIAWSFLEEDRQIAAVSVRGNDVCVAVSVEVAHRERDGAVGHSGTAEKDRLDVERRDPRGVSPQAASE